MLKLWKASYQTACETCLLFEMRVNSQGFKSKYFNFGTASFTKNNAVHLIGCQNSFFAPFSSFLWFYCCCRHNHDSYVNVKFICNSLHTPGMSGKHFTIINLFKQVIQSTSLLRNALSLGLHLSKLLIVFQSMNFRTWSQFCNFSVET